MQEVPPDTVTARALAYYEALGGVLDYVLLRAAIVVPAPEVHRDTALAGIAAIDQRLKERELQFRLTWDAEKLKGNPIGFETFWGTDDVEPKRTSASSVVIPNVDGYKTAFFHPPYGLRGKPHHHAQIFEEINRFVLGEQPGTCETFTWSTDWSNYFEAGLEWWGAYFWTVRQPGSDLITVIGASATD